MYICHVTVHDLDPVCHTQIAKELLLAGASLHEAALENDDRLDVNILSEVNERDEEDDFNGETPLEIARFKNHYQLHRMMQVRFTR